MPQFSNQVRFDPWVGANYGRRSRFGVGVLVLGEAHYGLDHEYDRNLTIELTADYKEGRWNSRFWTNIGQAIMGKHHTDFVRGDVWDHCALYNYVQSFPADRARVAPSRKQWGESELPFREVLGELRPDFVLVLGERLWDHLPTDYNPGPKVEVDGEQKDTVWYSGNSYQALAGRIFHPSSGFDYTRWHPWIEQMLILSRGATPEKR